MSSEQPQLSAPRPSFGRRMGLALVKLLSAFIKLVIFLALIAGLAAGVYYGSLFVSQRLLIPMEENTARLNELAESQEQAAEDSGQQLAALQSQLSTVEAARLADQEIIAGLQSRLAELEESLPARLTLVEAEASASSERLAEIDSALAGIETEMTAWKATVESQGESLTAISDSQDARAAAIGALELELKQIKVMELLIRSSMFLEQKNFGLARQDVVTARELLASLQAELQPEQIETLKAVLLRLDLVLGNLPDNPEPAIADLEIAWNILASGLPAGGLNAPAKTPTPTPAPAGDTPTPTPAMSETPGETPSATPSATPTPTPTP